MANLPEAEKQEMYLDKEAAFLINQYKIGRITRKDIENAINGVHEDRRENFRRLLNKYRGSKKNEK